MPDARYTNRYKAAPKRKSDEMYEIVQLLRINGARVVRIGTHAFGVKMGPTFKQKKLTAQELKEQFGHGSTSYKILRTHKLASSVKVAKPKSKPRNAVLA